MCIRHRNGEARKVVMKIDWKQIGRFVALIVKLFSHLTETFKKVGVGPEILEWITGDGKEVFEKEFLVPLALRFGSDDNRFLTVNMESEPDSRTTESNEYTVRRHHRFGTVVVERRGDDLYIDGKKLVLYFSPHQKSGNKVTIEGLDKELRGKKLPNINLLYALFDNQQTMIPSAWKNYQTIYCLGTSWEHDVESGDQVTIIRYFCYATDDKCWIIDTTHTYHDACQFPVLVFEE